MLARFKEFVATLRNSLPSSGQLFSIPPVADRTDVGLLSDDELTLPERYAASVCLAQVVGIISLTKFTDISRLLKHHC